MLGNSEIPYLQSRAVFILSAGSLLGLWSVPSKTAGELALLSCFRYKVRNLWCILVSTMSWPRWVSCAMTWAGSYNS